MSHQKHLQNKVDTSDDLAHWRCVINPSTCYKLYNSLFLRVNSLRVYFPLMQCILQAAGTRLWAVPPPPPVRVCLLPGTWGSLQCHAGALWCSGTWQSLPRGGKEWWNLLTHRELSLESCPRPKTVFFFFFSISLTSKLKKSAWEYRY